MSETVSNGEGSTGLSESETGRHHYPGLHQGDVHTEDLHGGTQRMNKELTNLALALVWFPLQSRPCVSHLFHSGHF